MHLFVPIHEHRLLPEAQSSATAWRPQVHHRPSPCTRARLTNAQAVWPAACSGGTPMAGGVRMQSAVLVSCGLFSLVSACGGRSSAAESADASPDQGDSNPAPLVVVCGASRCHAANGEGCCSTPSTPPAVACATSCPAGDMLRCDGPEDCPGQKCCSRFLPSSYSEAVCTDECPWGSALQLCHTDTDCVGASAPGATRCCPLAANAFPGAGVCDAPSGDFCAH